MKNNNPYLNRFFIIGYPRSGTSLLRRLLNSYDDIVIPPEAGFMIYFYEKYKNSIFNQNDILLTCLNDIQNSRKFNFWEIDLFKMLDNSRFSGLTSYLELCDYIYYYYAYNQKKNFKLVGDKNNFHTKHIKLLSKIFQSSKFIHIVRDGRDVVASFKKLSYIPAKLRNEYFPEIPNEILDIAHKWDDNLNIIHEVFSNIKASRVITIKYEDLVSDSKNTLKKLLDFLEISTKTEYINLKSIEKLNSEPNNYFLWKSLVDQPITKDRINSHQEILDNNEISKVEQIAKENLKRYGYV